MPRRVVLVSVTAIVLVLAASSMAVWYASEQGKDTGTIKGLANVKSVRIIILESFPVQVNVVVYGELTDSCTEIGNIRTKREPTTFIITVSTTRPADAVCAQVIIPFEKVIPLDVVGLKAGVYTVRVNGVTDTFELQADNIVQTASQVTICLPSIARANYWQKMLEGNQHLR